METLVFHLTKVQNDLSHQQVPVHDIELNRLMKPEEPIVQEGEVNDVGFHDYSL